MIRGDSSEYDLLKKWCDETKVYTPYNRFYSCEIGVREGLGSKIIMDSFREKLAGKRYMHFGIDPYSNLNYQHYDNTGSYTCDYTDEMCEQMQKDFESYQCFNFIKMTDTEFMKENGHLEYFNFVHFDGPHMTKDVITESVWFANRSIRGTRFVFDDYLKYNMATIAKCLEFYDFKVIESGKNKCLMERNV
jgi:hypothetical protein